MDLKKISSLTIFFAILMIIYTGTIQFIGPACHIANWSNWEFLGLTKAQYINVHTTFTVLFVIALSIHLYYNLGKLLSYTKQKISKFTIFTNEFFFASLLSIAVLVGTLYEKSPFIELLNFGTQLENEWEKQIGTPPFTHAELSSLLVFTRKMGYDLERTKAILINNNIEFREPQSLAQIAKQNDVSPKFLYDLIKMNFTREVIRVDKFVYVDKKLINDVATLLEMTSDEFLGKINDMGLQSKAAKIFSLAKIHYITPYQIVKELGLKKQVKINL